MEPSATESMIQLHASIVEAVVEHSRFAGVEEACGLLATDEKGTVQFAYSLTNAARSANSFTIDPSEFHGAACHAERLGWEIGGVFHSHPGGTLVPSKTDMDNAPSPAWLYVIVSGSQLAAFRIVGHRYRRLAISTQPLPIGPPEG